MEREDGMWALLRRAPVDWTEPFVIGLLVFHVLCLIVTVISFRFYKLQIAHFLFMITLVICAQYINEFAALNWKMYSRQQYFDSSGMFISFAFSVPLLCNTIVIVVYWVYTTLSVMTELKTLQRKRRSAKEQKKAN